MNILEIIEKKKDGLELNYDELSYAFNGYLDKAIDDYQMSALLMAITINGMNQEEINNLTDIFVKSGDTYNVSDIFDNTVDKHSTGGVGDTTTLIVGPIVACLGLKMAKMSGGGLGFTGGTIDKLESIPGFNVSISKQELLDNVRKSGFAISAQTDNLVPLDKVVYELRSVTATSKSLPLIAVSIMSKKIALGAKNILIDVKYGSGALIKDLDEVHIFNEMVTNIGIHFNRNVRTIASNMDTPLSYAIGNSIEVLEVIRVLKGEKCPLLDKSIELSAHLLSMSKNIDYNEAYSMCSEVVNNKSALNKFYEFVSNQGGDIKQIKVSNKYLKVKAKHSGTIKKIDANGVAKLAFKLGAGRLTKEGKVDYTVGVMLNKYLNDYVNQDETIMYLHVKDENILFNKDDFAFIDISE